MHGRKLACHCLLIETPLAAIKIFCPHNPFEFHHQSLGGNAIYRLVILLNEYSFSYNQHNKIPN